jgi:hypothetical protein
VSGDGWKASLGLPSPFFLRASHPSQPLPAASKAKDPVLQNMAVCSAFLQRSSSVVTWYRKGFLHSPVASVFISMLPVFQWWSLCVLLGNDHCHRMPGSLPCSKVLLITDLVLEHRCLV